MPQGQVALIFRLTMRAYQSIDEEMMSPLVSTASPVTCELCPFIVSRTSPLWRSQRKTNVSIPPETIPPSGKRSEGGIQANGPTKLECPVRVLERRYSPSFSGFRVQNFTVRSLDDVAIPASPHTQMPRTCRRVNKICRP